MKLLFSLGDYTSIWATGDARFKLTASTQRWPNGHGWTLHGSIYKFTADGWKDVAVYTEELADKGEFRTQEDARKYIDDKLWQMTVMFHNGE